MNRDFHNLKHFMENSEATVGTVHYLHYKYIADYLKNGGADVSEYDLRRPGVGANLDSRNIREGT